MAPFSNYFSFLLFTTLLLFSMQINARDSQFFSKVNHFTANNNNVKETELPNKQEEPAFFPETETGCGLYGHETSQNPPDTATSAAAATTTYKPYKTEAEEMSKYNNNKYYSYHKNEIGEENLRDGYYKSMENQNYNNNNNRKYYYNNNGGYYNNRYVNGERQGMSDTRFVEGGKYFYDLNSEKYNPTSHGESSRNVDSGKWSNYFGHNNANLYENNYNSMGGYQNQDEVFEDDLDGHFEP